MFSQLITIPLFRDHKILSQVASHAGHTIKLLPSLVISDADCDDILKAFAAVLAESERVPDAGVVAEQGFDRQCATCQCVKRE